MRRLADAFNRSAQRIEDLVQSQRSTLAGASHERIFEPFVRPPGLREGEDPGAGLGLALVRQIAQHHGGTVVCEDREGGGSRFRVRLPAITS